MTRPKLEVFSNGIKVYQCQDGYKFTKDAIDLAKFCNIKHTDQVLEMCAGSGVISLYAYNINNFAKLYLNELQEDVCKIIEKNIELNNLRDKAKCINKNLKDLTIEDFDKKLDIIICNPPYFKVNGSEINENYSVAVSRHELAVTLKEIVEVASRLIKDKGKFYICMTAERCSELIFELEQKCFVCKRIKFIINSKKEARLVLIEAVYKANCGVKICVE